MAIYSGGPEFLVNTVTLNHQINPTIISLLSGGFVVSWEDQSPASDGVYQYDIKAQIFDGSGAKVGAEFLVNTATPGFQYAPTITPLSSGGFVVSWEDQSGQGGDASGYGIKAQIFDAAGAKVAAEFLVNTMTANDQSSPAITSLASGGFVVSWGDGSGQGGDADGGITAQIFDGSGAKVGAEVLVNTATQSFQFRPTITSLASGGFVVSWEDASGQGGDASFVGIKAQIFNASGAKVGAEFLVNTETFGTQLYPTITSLASGGFVVSWNDPSRQGGDASGYGIKAQVFDASGATLGTEFLVNTVTLDDQYFPAITSLSSGGFVVSWQDESGRGGDGSNFSVKAQIFDASGAKDGSEFLVNTVTQNSQSHPTITSLASGAFVASWVDLSGQGGDASGYGVKARIFSLVDEFNRISGTTGDDTLAGTEDADLIRAFAGDDVLLGNGGDDELHGNRGSDTLLGGEGHDELYGGGGDDFLFGGNGNDLLDGYAGDDQLIDLFGNNVFDTGRGNDLVVAGAGDDEFLFFAAGRGDDSVDGFGSANDLIRLIGTSFVDFDDVLAAGQDTDAGWRLQIDNNTSVTLFGIIETQLVVDDFIFL